MGWGGMGRCGATRSPPTPDATPPLYSPRHSGLYLPPLPVKGQPSTGLRKGHVRCLRCVVCRDAVVLDAWLEGPAHRPYHQRCWDKHCDKLCDRPDDVPPFAEDPAVTDLECAHALAAAIQKSSPQAMQHLLRLRPHLHNFPLPGVPSARHRAALTGNLDALYVLLGMHTGLPDVWNVVCSPTPRAVACSTPSLYPPCPPHTPHTRTSKAQRTMICYTELRAMKTVGQARLELIAVKQT